MVAAFERVAPSQSELRLKAPSLLLWTTERGESSEKAPRGCVRLWVRYPQGVQELLGAPAHVAVLNDLALLRKLKFTKRFQSASDKPSEQPGTQTLAISKTNTSSRVRNLI